MLLNAIVNKYIIADYWNSRYWLYCRLSGRLWGQLFAKFI